MRSLTRVFVTIMSEVESAGAQANALAGSYERYLLCACMCFPDDAVLKSGSVSPVCGLQFVAFFENSLCVG